jgi:hypothetical protein
MLKVCGVWAAVRTFAFIMGFYGIAASGTAKLKVALRDFEVQSANEFSYGEGKVNVDQTLRDGWLTHGAAILRRA